VRGVGIATVLGASLLVALVAVWAVASLTWPFGLDQGIFAWVGDTILRGGVPYRDAWEIKGPATHYLYALAQLVFGRHVYGLRVLDLALLAASALAAFGLVARARAGPRTLAGVTAGALWVLLYATGGYWHAAQPDGWAAMAWLGAAWAAARPRPTGAHWILAGGLCGIAMLLKPPFGAFAGLLWLDRVWRDDLGAALRAAPALAAGLLGVLALAVLGFGSAEALDELVEVQLVFNPSLHPTAYRGLGAADVAQAWLRWLSQPWAGPAFAAGIAGVVLAWRRARADALLIAGWLVLGIALVTVQNQYFHYHFWPLLAGLAAGAGLAAREAGECTERAGRMTARAVRAGTGALLALALLASAWGPVHQIRAATAALPGATSERSERYRDAFGMGSYGFASMERIAAHIAERTRPGDAILVWGFEAGLYFLADRASSTRFGFPYALVRGGGSELERGYLEEFTESLEQHPPAYVVVFAQSYDESALPAENRTALAAFRSRLERCYVPDASLAAERVRGWLRDPERCP
jgi:hypothetical protein